MQKTIAITGILLLGIFIGVFSVSALNKRVRQKSITAIKTDAIETTTSSKPIDIEEKPLFYTSVGGSSPPTESPNTEAKVSTRFTIELGTVKSQDDAESMLLRLKDRGIDGFYTPMRRGGEVLFHVRIGLFTSAEDAEQSRKKIASRANVAGRVTKLH